MPDSAEREWNEVFDEICRNYRNRLVRWSTKIFGARDAEDIAQEALARLFVRPELLADDADPWPWLSVVARNVGRDIARHSSYSTTIENAVFDLFSDGSRVQDLVAARQDAQVLDRALMSLDPRDRALIRLRELQDVAVVDIASAMGMNDNSVRQQLFRARNRLAAAFLSLGGNPRDGDGPRSQPLSQPRAPDGTGACRCPGACREGRDMGPLPTGSARAG